MQANMESSIRSQVQLITDVQQGLAMNVQKMEEAMKKFKEENFK